jgi:hypothetical protein
METVDREQARVMPSIPSLIAWLSVCMLAAAVGHTLDEHWQPVWARMGTFGLVAAVGLGSLEKTREVREKSSYDRHMQARVECGLERFNQHSAAVDSINEALNRLAKHAARERRGTAGKSAFAARPQGMQLLESYPLEIMPVEDQGPKLDFGSAGAIAGSVRQISSRVVSFDHCVSFGTRMALLTFQLCGRDQLSFVVDIMWTEKADGGFVSGGTLLAVGVPEFQDQAVVLTSPNNH